MTSWHILYKFCVHLTTVEKGTIPRNIASCGINEVSDWHSWMMCSETCSFCLPERKHLPGRQTTI